MKSTFISKSGRVYTVNDYYPQISPEEGLRRQKDAVMCIVRMLRESSPPHSQKPAN